MGADIALPWRKGMFPGVTRSWWGWDLPRPDPGKAIMGCQELSEVDSSRERRLEVRVRDADLYSRSYMLHMLFPHLANGPAVIITMLSGQKSYCLIVFLLKLFVCSFLESRGSCRSAAYASCGFSVTSCGLTPATASVHSDVKRWSKPILTVLPTTSVWFWSLKVGNGAIAILFSGSHKWPYWDKRVELIRIGSDWEESPLQLW